VESRAINLDMSWQVCGEIVCWWDPCHIAEGAHTKHTWPHMWKRERLFCTKLAFCIYYCIMLCSFVVPLVTKLWTLTYGGLKSGVLGDSFVPKNVFHIY